MKTITTSLEKAISYQSYRIQVKELLDKGESTTKNGGESLVEYSKLNHSRMNRLDKTSKLPNDVAERLLKLDKSITWLVITEGWCGDAAQNLPMINLFTEHSEMINLKLVLRDENPELMNEFLTNGNKAIPKLIQIENGEVTKTWGPRPTTATKMVADYKKEHGRLTPEFKKDLQIWYNKNKGENMIEDLLELLF